MVAALDKIAWSDTPLFPEVRDPAWEAEVQAALGVVPRCAKLLAPSAWLRRTYLDNLTCPTSLTEPQALLAVLVTSQENSCRYCYGVAHAQMRMLGFSERVVEEVESRAQLAEADPADRELLKFCRNLARSKPRPSREARRALEAVGFSSVQSAEIAWTVASSAFGNRIATLMATPPEVEMEAHASRTESLWQKLSSWLPGKATPARPPPPPAAPPQGGGEFGALVEILRGTSAAATLERSLGNAFSGSLLPRRTILLMFAVVSRTLDCAICEGLSTRRLEACGMPRAAVADVLTTLSSKDLTDLEAVLLPWTRETVWMPEEPKRIQEHTRPLIQKIGGDHVLDAIGIASLANACVRLAMLLQ